MSVSNLMVAQTPRTVGAAAEYPFSAKLQQKFVMLSRFGEPVPLYKIRTGSIYLPRAVCPEPHPSNDNRTSGQPVSFACSAMPRSEEQARVVEETVEFLEAGLSGIVQASTGFGKCHGAGTEVILADGSLRRVEDLKAGDRLMGPDSQPRTILSVTQGVGPLFRVTGRNGDSFVCNDVHVLSLKRTRTWRTENWSREREGRAGEIVNVPLDEYLGWSASMKHLYKLWRVPVDFPAQPKLFLDAYFLGVLLGDGSLRDQISVTTADPEIVGEVYRQAELHGLRVRVEPMAGNKASNYHFASDDGQGSSSLRGCLRSAGLLGVSCADKFIPSRYLRASHEDRLRLLAGLLDSDGYHIKGCYEFCVKAECLATDTAFLARSLGFAVSRTVKVVKGTTYHRLTLSGHTDQIPCRLARKKAEPRQQKKDPLVSGFTIEPIGEGAYYGFELDGDHLYLLKDFTVTHNTVVSMMTIARLGLPTLIVVTKEDLMKQWQEAAEKFLGLTREDYGIIQGDVCDVKGKKLAIGMIHSLAKEGRYPDWAYNQWGLVCFDECHRVAADQFSNVCFNVPARLRLGLSATPDRQDGKEFVLHAHIGPVRVKSKQLSMTPKVLVYTSDWECPRVIQRRSDGSRKVVPLPHTPGKVGHVVKMLIKHTKRQQLLAELVYTAWTRKRKTIFFSDSLDHLDLMQSALYAMGVPHKDLGFYKGGMKKQDLDKSKGKPVVLATYGFAREGTDIPWLDCMVMGTPKSEIEQIVGRVLREYPNKPQPVVFDVQDLDSNVFAGYAQKRIAFYQRIGADIRHM